MPDPNYWGTSIVKMQTANPAGTVKLRSRDPRDTPEINFNYFTHRADEDLQAMIDGVELLLRAADNAGVNYTQTLPNPDVSMRQGIMDDSFDITSIDKILKASSIVSGKDAEILFRSRPETHIDTTCYQISLDLTTYFQPPSATQPSYLSVRVHTLELRER